MLTKADQLIDAALALFQEQGYRATGIDAILKRAGVAKMTLYKHFATKDDLILAALRRADERSRALMFSDIERRASDPRGRLLALFDFASDWVTADEFRGCLFIRATGEFAEADGPIRMACSEHASIVTRYITGLAVQAGVREPEALANQLLLLFKGVLIAGQGGAEGAVIDSARTAARTLVDAALGGDAGSLETGQSDDAA